MLDSRSDTVGPRVGLTLQSDIGLLVPHSKHRIACRETVFFSMIVKGMIVEGNTRAQLVEIKLRISYFLLLPK